MEFSALNTLLISAGALIIGAAGAIASMASKFVRKTDCAYQHKYDLATVGQITRLVSKLERNTRIQFKMLRAMIAYMDLTAQQKAEILNTEAGERREDDY